MMNIFLDPKIWIYTTYEVHLELLKAVKKIALGKTNFFKEFITVQCLLDLCRIWYYYKDDQYSLGKSQGYSRLKSPFENEDLSGSISQLSLSSPFDAERFFEEEKSSSYPEPTILVRPTFEELSIFRRILLEIVAAFLKTSVSIEETKTLILFLEDCRDEKQIIEILQVIPSNK